MYAGLLVPSAGRSFVQNRFLLSLIRVMIWKNDICKRFFVPWQAEDIIARCGIREITIEILKGMNCGKKILKKNILSYIRRQNELVRQVRAEFHNELLNVFLFSFLFSFVCLSFSFFFFFLNDDGDLRLKKEEIRFSFDSPNRCGLCRAWN